MKDPAMSSVAAVAVFLVLGFAAAAHGENVKVGIPSLTVTMLPLAVARERGYFQQEGLNVELVLMPAALNIKVLLAGEIGYASTVGSAVVAAVRGIDVRVVMLFVDRPLLDLIASPEINSIADLKGRVIGISSRGGLHDVTIRKMLQQSGVDPGQATLLVVGGQGAMLAALMSGRISAGLLNPPHNFLGYRQGLKNLGFAGSYIRIPSTGLVTTRERLERSPDQVRRMARALARARAFARDNKAQALQVLKKFLQLEDEDLVARIYDYHKKVETADGKIDAALAAETIRDARQTEGITREVAVNQVFDFSYLEPGR
jgi:ABC-type nitrate/sulfonate/bicarbonate transport system substrate-binding protein